MCGHRSKLILNQYAHLFYEFLEGGKKKSHIPRGLVCPVFHFLCNTHSCVMMSSGVSPVNSTSYTPRGIISINRGLGHQNDKLNRVIPNDKTVQKANLMCLLL